MLIFGQSLWSTTEEIFFLFVWDCITGFQHIFRAFLWSTEFPWVTTGTPLSDFHTKGFPRDLQPKQARKCRKAFPLQLSPRSPVLFQPVICVGHPLQSCTCKKGAVPSLPPCYSIKYSVLSFLFIGLFLPLFLPFLLSCCLSSFLLSFPFLSLFLKNFSKRRALLSLTQHLIRAVKISCIHSGFSPGKSVRELAHFSRCQIEGWIQVWSEARGLFSSHGVQTKASARDRWDGDGVAHRRAKGCWHLSPQHTQHQAGSQLPQSEELCHRNGSKGGLCVPMARTEGRVENPKGMASPKEKWVLMSLGDKTTAFVAGFPYSPAAS